jgi:hypothetical protein
MAFKSSNNPEQGSEEDFQRGRDNYINGATLNVYETIKWQEGWYYEYYLQTEDETMSQP